MHKLLIALGLILLSGSSYAAGGRVYNGSPIGLMIAFLLIVFSANACSHGYKKAIKKTAFWLIPSGLIIGLMVAISTKSPVLILLSVVLFLIVGFMFDKVHKAKNRDFLLKKGHINE